MAEVEGPRTLRDVGPLLGRAVRWTVVQKRR